jgi:hypothetical protein
METTINYRLSPIPTRAIILVVLIAFSFSFSFSANILSKREYVKNGNFELGDTLFYTDYTHYALDWLKPEGSYAVIVNPRNTYYELDSCFDHTSNGGKFMVVNGSRTKDYIVWMQTYKSLKKNNDYEFSLWAENVNPKKPAILRVYINNVAQDPPIVLTWQTCEWSQWFYQWNSFDRDSAEIKIIDENLELYGNDFGLDDISFRPICSLSSTKLKDSLICIGESVKLNKVVTDGFPPFKYQWTPDPTMTAYDIPNPEVTPNRTTTYYVTITDEVGCSIFDSVTINVSNLPPTKISYNKKTTNICPCDSITLSAPEGKFFYKWSNGATTKDITVREAGDYTLTVINEFGCNASSIIEVKSLEASSTVMIDSMSVNIGEVVRFPIRLTSKINGDECRFSEFKTTIKFNRSLLQPFGRTPIGRIEGNYEIIELKSSLNSDTLGVLEFVAALGNSVCTDISFERFEWNCLDYQVKKFDGKFCLKNVCKEKGERLYDDTGEFYLKQNYPNPSSNKTEISFGIIEEGISRIVVYDILGNQVEVIGERFYTPGEYKVDLNTGILGRGIYFYSLQSPSQSSTKRMEILK